MFGYIFSCHFSDVVETVDELRLHEGRRLDAEPVGDAGRRVETDGGPLHGGVALKASSHSMWNSCCRQPGVPNAGRGIGAR